MKRLSCLLTAVAIASAMRSAMALTFGTPFADNAVLQRDVPLPVWGTATPGEEVRLEFAGRTKSAKSDSQGKWRVTLESLAVFSDGRNMTVCQVGDGQTLTVTNVLVGEVWFASGQSNMDFPLWKGGWSRYRDRKGAMMTMMTRLPQVRYATCPAKTCVTSRVYSASWHAFTRHDLERHKLSAVAFYYARELCLALGVPVGIVVAAVGGTGIDTWTPRPDGGKNEPSFYYGMVAAWTPMAMRGVIWYQGCTNQMHDDPSLYCAKMHALYGGWAKAFENGGLRLYFAQLAPYGGGWLPLVTQQNRFVAEEPNAALAVLSDVGNRHDIHPCDKETVAQRLALIALRRDYGFDIPEDESPVFKSARVSEDGRVTLTFGHARSWYAYADDYSKDVAFELAGTNGVWHAAKILNFRQKPKGGWADEYVIDSPDLVLQSARVARPVRVRYMGRGQYGTLFADTSLPLGAFEAPVGNGQGSAGE